jgi:hypothetical protein
LKKQLFAAVFEELCLFQKMPMNAHCCASVGCCQVDLRIGSQKRAKKRMPRFKAGYFILLFSLKKNKKAFWKNKEKGP